MTIVSLSFNVLNEVLFILVQYERCCPPSLPLCLYCCSNFFSCLFHHYVLVTMKWIICVYSGSWFPYVFSCLEDGRTYSKRNSRCFSIRISCKKEQWSLCHLLEIFSLPIQCVNSKRKLLFFLFPACNHIYFMTPCKICSLLYLN